MPRAPFDALAEDYDRRFASTEPGRLLRGRIWEEADRHFSPGDRILDLGCGSGEDTLHLARRGCRVVALDASAAMLRRTRDKAITAGLASNVRVAQAKIGSRRGGGLPLHAAAETEYRSIEAETRDAGRAVEKRPRGFDGAIASFGVLNCVDDLAAAADDLARSLRPGAVFIASVMPPACLWEFAWYLRAGDGRSAFRRLRRSGARADFGSGEMRVRYPGPRSLRRAFEPWFRQRSLAPLGLFIPPSYVWAWLAARPELASRLRRWDRATSSRSALAGFADHYLMVLERRVAR